MRMVWLLCLCLPLWAVAQTIPNQGVDLSGFDLRYHSLPFVDLDGDAARQVVVDREAGQYLGHPSSVLLPDGQTMYVVYPKGHGRGPIVMKRSPDGGRTWSDRLPVPANWASSLEVPVLAPTYDAAGAYHLRLFSGLYPARMASSADSGRSWTPLQPLGDWGGIVVMGDVTPLGTGAGHYLAFFHDDGRFIDWAGRSEGEQAQARAGMPAFTVYTTHSEDGGATWRAPRAIYTSRVLHLCEGGVIRSPDGRQLALLLRENSRRLNSHIMFSEDEGRTWSPPRPLPAALTGDRHQAVYGPDGRLFVSFRDYSPAPARYEALRRACTDCDPAALKAQAGAASPTHGDWVAWIGRYEDLVEGREGQYRLRLKDNTRGTDCAYPALEVLPDGTIVATTYGHWTAGEPPWILSVRLRLEEWPERGWD
ncbi:MAG: exo-alpha-sialidase [Bacteroidetes bacterium]|nr:MAG: exo-alpha-sialidase [Bacteroidota bacterium]